MKRKILFISDYSLSVPGGAQNSMKIIMQGLADYFDFYIICPGQEVENTESNLNCIFLSDYENFSFFDSFGLARRLTKDIGAIVKKLRPDLIHTQMPSSMGAVVLLSLLKRINMPLIHTDRGVYNAYGKKVKLFLLGALARFNSFVTTTNCGRSEYVKRFGMFESKIRTIANTPGPLFESFDRELEVLNKSKIGVSKRTIMFNGRLTDDKNWPMSLEVMRWLSSNYDFQFIVVVSSDRSAEDINRCKDLIAKVASIVGEQNLRSYIDIDLQQVSDLFYASDIFVMTSKTESFGRTAVEAMSRGNVVFGTDVDGLAEVILFEDYRFKDISDFKKKFSAFEKVDLNEEKNRFMKRFREEFTFEKNISKHLELYESVLDEGE